MESISELSHRQSGMISRQQALAHGFADHDLRRLLRHNDLRAVHPGVYADHTGPLTWLQEAWAAVLYAWPAVLSHESAMRAAQPASRFASPILREHHAIHVAIDHRRTVVSRPGIVIHRTHQFDERVQWNLSPPRMRLEEAAIDLAAAARCDLDAIGVLAGVVSARQTTAPRLLAALSRRSRVGRRTFLNGVLTDVTQGTCSVLEHGYLTLVERPHGLPRAVRQARPPGQESLYRDVLYEDFGQIVELDGRIFHAGPHQRDADLDRDLDAAIDALASVRLGWGQVFDRACATAAKIGRLLQLRGWAGAPRPCPRCALAA
ncbi:type IV toxin-antitoxin system AbiEi family antitoxin domain-containing protein [Nocardioides sp. AE5]|uniref:type IV toxin-antitoxin system AbiEi family antitoxin domain-containing protein n=1 Tax=Nocardioides sp. AE5 TaxID=2962573 RepID=UPI0028824531|nr:type IV toxin-antitoxin system AbiEi family antitoxin domain-containing protein [Nocardioides sp. AE5]MDT0201128.1 type IV toxin-antitoxin system AbiEi family antitoxin domain-containing protein [Nocardioides sp. AE5]